VWSYTHVSFNADATVQNTPYKKYQIEVSFTFHQTVNSDIVFVMKASDESSILLIALSSIDLSTIFFRSRSVFGIHHQGLTFVQAVASTQIQKFHSLQICHIILIDYQINIF
jgi:hypothetical protein